MTAIQENAHLCPTRVKRTSVFNETIAGVFACQTILVSES